MSQTWRENHVMVRILKGKWKINRSILYGQSTPELKLKHYKRKYEFDVHGSVHLNINLMERTNKMQPCSRIYVLFQCFLIAEHVLGDTPPIIRSSKTVIAASGFTYVYGCRSLRWLSHRSGNRQPKTYVKPEATITVFEPLMMGGVSPKAC